MPDCRVTWLKRATDEQLLAEVARRGVIMSPNRIGWLKTFFALSLMANVCMFLAICRAYGTISGMALIN